MSFIADVISILSGLLAILGLGALTGRLPQSFKDRWLLGASIGNNVGIVHYTLGIEASPNGSKDHQANWSPLHYASFNKNLEIMEALIKHGANLEAKDSGGYTPLYYAISSERAQSLERGSLQDQICAAAKLLLQHGAKPGTEIRNKQEAHDYPDLKNILDFYSEEGNRTASQVREEMIAMFVEQYRKMLEENIDDNCSSYKNYL